MTKAPENPTIIQRLWDIKKLLKEITVELIETEKFNTVPHITTMLAHLDSLTNHMDDFGELMCDQDGEDFEI